MCKSGNCNEGLSSAKCVEFDENYTVYQLFVELQRQLNNVSSHFEKEIDGKTLGTGKDLIKTTQALVDKVIKPSVNNTVTNIAVDLQCLANSFSGSITQNQLNNLLLKQICFLTSELNNLKSII